MKSERSSNVELLRAILAFMVIVLHYNHASMPGNGGAAALVSEDSIRNVVIHITEALANCAVNTFLLISGYFGAEQHKINFSKVISLFAKVIIYNFALYSVCIIGGMEPFNFRTAISRIIPTNYYIILYAVVYLFSPYINYMVRALPERKLDLLIFLVVIAFSIEPTVVNLFQSKFQVSLVGVSTVALDGDGAGYTVVNFLMLYLIGAYIRKRKAVFSRISAKLYLLFYVGIALIIAVLSCREQCMWYYSNSLVIAEAIVLFMIFQSIQIPQSKCINYLGRCSLDIFLIHTNPLLMVNFWGNFHIAENYASLPWWKVYGFSTFATFSMYVVCVLIAIGYDILFSDLVNNYISRKKYYIEVQ